MNRSEALDDVREELRLADSFTRLPIILNATIKLDRHDWLTLLGDEWESCDNIGVYADDVLDAICGYDAFGNLSEMMTEDERCALQNLPETVVVYRGCYEWNKWGFSWSLERATAEGFPFLPRYHHPGRPLLIKAEAKRCDIAALKTGRHEHEVILFKRPKYLSISSARPQS
jgi:hypothetical protein